MKAEATEPVTGTKLTLQIIFQHALSKNMGMFFHEASKFTTRNRTFIVSNLEKQIMGQFTLFKSPKNGEYYFNLKANNHEIILQSEGYKAKSGAENGIESVKINAAIEENFERKIAKDDSFYFNLKAANGEIIGTSEMYKSKGSVETGIASVRSTAPTAQIILAN